MGSLRLILPLSAKLLAASGVGDHSADKQNTSERLPYS